MASQVTVIGPAARRHTVKTTPGTYLSDVLQQACAKFNLDPEQYGLKHNSKNVDTSITMRLSGLSGGAKLELTMLSKSPSVVNVALQLPSNSRFTDKFPSTTTLWLILRKFESGVAGNGSTLNFTGRGVPRMGEQGGSGRLYYEQPTLQIMGRDYTTFTDLQRTLRQLGFNSGSVLLKLSYTATETPLEEAMEQIEGHFKSVDADEAPTSQPAAASAVASATNPTEPATIPADVPADVPANDATDPSTQAIQQPPQQDTPASEPPAASTTTDMPETGGTTTIANRATAIFRPPSSSTPQAAQTPHNPQDYVPTVEHARVHQASLVKAGQNTRLLTDAELETQATERAARRAAIDRVTIKVRFPDESSAVADFGALDTADELYAHVEGLLRTGADEPFELAHADPKTGKVVPLSRNQQKLIAQLGLQGKVLVQVRWMPGASNAARKGASLRDDVAGLGREVEINKVPDAPPEENKVGAAEKLKNFLGTGSSKEDGSGGKEKGKGGVPKWFKVGKK